MGERENERKMSESNVIGNETRKLRKWKLKKFRIRMRVNSAFQVEIVVFFKPALNFAGQTESREAQRKHSF